MNEGAERESQEMALATFLNVARELMRRGQEKEAEDLFKRAMTHAEVVAGENSPLVGLVLMDMMDFYDHFKRQDEGKQLWTRLRHMLLAYLRTDEWGDGLADCLEHN